jgi:hypothetical protein
MSNTLQKKARDEKPKWQMSLLPLIGLLLGGSALWFAWFRYNLMLNQPASAWYQWVQTAAIGLVGVLCILGTVLFYFDRSSGRAVLKTGLSIIPLILFANLIYLIFRVIQNIAEGNAMSFLSRLYANPLNKAILIVAVILIVLSILKEIEKE